MLDYSTFNWNQLGACFRFGVTSPEDDFWFDAYEKSDSVAHNVDEMCAGCPVKDACYNYGVDNKLYGVWGGVYLENGKQSESKNRHKSEEMWERLGRTPE